MFDFDIVLSEIGLLGRYQLFLVLACMWSMVPIASNLSGVIFLGYKEPSRCAIPEVDEHVTSGNLTEEAVRRVMIPRLTDSEFHSTCTKYDYNMTSCPNNTVMCMVQQANLTSGATPSVTACLDGYKHDRELFVETITTEWDLVCEKSGLTSLSTALFCFGMLLGSLVGGSIADRYGRIPTMVCGTLINVGVGVACSFSPNFVVFAALRCIIGAAAVAIQLAMAVYTVEIVGKKCRPWVGLQVGVMSGLGYLFLSLLAYLFRHWRTLQLLLGLIFIPFLLVAPFIPESPRLLFAQGKIEKAKKICRMMARRNGRTLNEAIWVKAESSNYVAAHRRYSPKEICKRPRVCLLLFMVTILWFVNGLIFFCLSFNVGHWSGNPFLNNALSGLVEFVACLLVVPLINRFGRRNVNVTSLVVAGSLILIAEIIKIAFQSSAGAGIAEVAILLVAKFTISASFNMLFLYTAELFPTHIRNTALGISTVGGRASSIVAPFLIEVQHYSSWLLPVILGISGLATAFVAWKCPETKGISMFSTLEEAEAFYKGKKRKDRKVLINNNKEDFTPPLEINAPIVVDVTP